jgi:hypothetical protein
MSMMHIHKTDKSKRCLFSFGGKLLTDEKLPQFILRSIFNPTHHSPPFLVLFLAVGTDLVGKRCGCISFLENPFFYVEYHFFSKK